MLRAKPLSDEEWTKTFELALHRVRTETWAQAYRRILKEKRIKDRLLNGNSQARRLARIRKNGGKYTKKDIEAMLVSQRGLCVLCQCDISREFHIDHIIRVRDGGSSDPSNLQLLCPPCNRGKH